MKIIAKKIVIFYLKILAKIVLWRFQPEIIVIAGTYNKTPTKNYLVKVLSNFFSVQYPPRSYNTDIGVPLTILGVTLNNDNISWLKILLQATINAISIKKYPNNLILEFGSDQPGDIDYLSSIIPAPKIVILTNIASEYISNFGSLDDIAKEFSSLTKKLPPTSYLIYNHDDQRLLKLAQSSPAQPISYAISATTADWLVEKIEQSNQGQDIIINHHGDKITIKTKHFGKHSIYTILICLAVIDIYNLPLEESTILFE